MRIPQGNFGNVIAEPGRQALVPQDNQIGNALGRVGDAITQLGEVQQVKQRAAAASTLATLTNDMHDIHDQVSQEVTTGKIKPEEAISTYQQRVDDIKKTRTEGLSPDQLQVIDSHIITADGTLKRSLNGVVIKRTESDADASVMSTGEQLQRSAMRDLPGAIKSWDSVVDNVPHWTPVKKAEAKQKFLEGATYNFANATLEGAAQTGNLDLVRAARQKIEGADGEPIDPAKRTALITKAYAYENGILASNARDNEKALREQQARENAGTDAYNKAFDLWSQGRYFSQDFINETSQVVTGTTAQAKFLELVKSQKEVAGFASLPLPQQQAQIERMRAAGSDPQVGVDPLEQKVQTQFERIHEESAKAYKENPWQAAQERGVITDAPVFNVANVQQAQQVLAERMKSIGQIEVAAGRKVSPLQPPEAEQIGRLVRALPPDQQSSALASFGTVVGDGDRLAALAQQIDAKDKVLGTAMMMANAKTTQGRYVSELILKGERALKDKSILVDNHQETGWRGAIAKEIGDAFPSDEVRQRMLDAAYYVQAGFSAEGGGSDISRAVRLVAGRIVERGGSKVPLPYGMEEADFDKRLQAIKPADLAGQAPDGKVYTNGGKVAIPVEQFLQQLPNAALVHAGQGKYNVRGGLGLITDKQGKRITIGVR